MEAGVILSTYGCDALHLAEVFVTDLVFATDGGT